jgi:radical SAM superfamily enzyme YgiQ (UPF0313 family)
MSYSDCGRLIAISPRTAGIPHTVRAAVVDDFDATPFPSRPIVPLIGTVHERISLEIMRGCTRGCRFCHAGITRRPVRWRSVETLLRQAREAIDATGYDQIGLTSLSSSDHPDLPRMLDAFAAEFGPEQVSLSVPSLRVNEQLGDLPRHVAGVRKSGLTIAPEAATEPARRAMNKMITDEDLFAGVRAAFESGWRLVKLYFMIGLPGETDEDAVHIADLAQRLSAVRTKLGKGPGLINVSVASFVPKPHTPFQWEAMATPELLLHRQKLIRQNKTYRQVKVRFHDVERSVIEAVFARGGRRLGSVLLDAWRRGARMDSWDEQFNLAAWHAAFEAAPFDPVAEIARREHDVDELLPWSMIDCGVSRRFLLAERDKARRLEWTEDCRLAGCTGCGVCSGAAAG